MRRRCERFRETKLYQGCLGTRGNDQDVFITKGRHFGEQLAFRVEKAALISRKQKGGCTVNVVERSRFCWAKSSKIAVEMKLNALGFQATAEFQGRTFHVTKSRELLDTFNSL